MDERLRGLERRAVEGDLQAEAAVLRRRVAMRELPRKRLRLAAVLGHAPAHWIYEQTPKIRPGRFDKWVRAIRHFGGDEGRVRAQLAAAEALLPIWEAAFPGEGSSVRELVALGWRVVVGEAGQGELRRAANALERRCRELTPHRRRAGDLLAATQARGIEAGRGIGYATLLAAGTRAWGSAIDVATRLLGEDPVREAIKGRLIPWALREDSR